MHPLKQAYSLNYLNPTKSLKTHDGYMERKLELLDEELNHTFRKSLFAPTSNIPKDPDAVHASLPPKYTSETTLERTFISTLKHKKNKFSLDGVILRP